MTEKDHLDELLNNVRERVPPYRRKEVIGDCTLYLGNCLDVLPDLGDFDALATDPPYGMGEATGTMAKANSSKRLYNEFEDTAAAVSSVYVPAVSMALSKSQGRGIVTPGNMHAWSYPKPTVIGAFNQPAGMGMCAWGRSTMQIILFYGRDPMVGKTISPITYNLTEAPDRNGHPCPKPIKAWTWVVSRASISGEHVIDPFMGSGTTGVACLKLGRKFTGIELDEAYFDIACRRIEAAAREPDMFINQPKMVKQEAML